MIFNMAESHNGLSTERHFQDLRSLTILSPQVSSRALGEGSAALSAPPCLTNYRTRPLPNEGSNYGKEEGFSKSSLWLDVRTPRRAGGVSQRLRDGPENARCCSPPEPWQGACENMVIAAAETMKREPDGEQEEDHRSLPNENQPVPLGCLPLLSAAPGLLSEFTGAVGAVFNRVRYLIESRRMIVAPA